MQGLNKISQAPRSILDLSFGSYNKINPGYAAQPVIPGQSVPSVGGAYGPQISAYSSNLPEVFNNNTRQGLASN